MAFGADAKVVIEAILRDKASGALRGLQGKMSGFGSKMLTVGSRIRSAGQSMTIGLTAPIIGAGIAIFKASIGFGDAMAQIVALSNVSQEQMAEWREEVLRLGPAVAKSPQELADALFFLASAGLDAGTEIDVLEIAARGSAVGLGETKTVALALTSIMNAYGQENVNAADATGVLIAAVREGRTETDELAGVMGRVLPLASELGIGYEEVAGALAALSLINEDASENATAFLGIMRAVVKPSKAAKDMLSEVGLSMADVRQQMDEKGLITTLQSLRNEFGFNIEELGVLFPRVRGLTGLLNLTGKNAAKVDEVFKRVAEGSAKDLEFAFEAVQTPGFQMRQAMAEIQVSLIRLGDVIVPIVAKWLPKLVQGLQAATQWFTGLPPGVQKGILVFIALLAAVGPLLIVIGSLIAAVGAFALAFGTTIGMILLVASGIGLVILAVIALSIGIFFLVRNWDKVMAFLQSVGGHMVKFFTETVPGALAQFRDKAVSILKKAGTELLDAIVGKLEDIRDKLREFGEGIKDDLRERFDALIEPAINFGTNLAETFRFYFELLKPIIQFGFNFIRGQFGNQFAILMEIIGFAVRAWQTLFVSGFKLVFAVIQFYWAIFVLVFRVATETILTALQTWWGITSALWTGFFRIVVAIIRFHWQLIKSIFIIAVTVLLNGLAVFFAVLRGDWSEAWRLIKETFFVVWEEIKNILRTALGQALVMVFTVWDTVKEVTTTAWEGIRDTILDALLAVKEEGGAILNGFINVIETALNAVIGGINTFTDGVNSAGNILEQIPFAPNIPDIPKIPTVSLPRLDVGGRILESGLAVVHRGEHVVPKGGSLAGGGVNLTIHFNAPVTEEAADANAEAIRDAVRQHVLRLGSA